MSRRMRVSVVQLGPIPKDDSREKTMLRLLNLFEDATADDRTDLVVFPELALTSFFPHWEIRDSEELHAYYESEIPSPGMAPLLEASKRKGVAVTFGYGERTAENRLFNTASLFKGEKELLRFRKVHLPGYNEVQPDIRHQNLEKMYFRVGDLGFPVVDFKNTRIGLLICNDRRWPESYRMLSLQGAELVCIGYNSPIHTPSIAEADILTDFHNELSMQAGAYQNSMWVIGAAKGGVEEGVDQIGGSCIIAPNGKIVAQAVSNSDEVIGADIDLDMSARFRKHMFNFTLHRRPELYRAITEPMPEGWPRPALSS
ncbi:nitrilase-related carbon-nitrogen hydrolase [Nesterenkonia ebinurensis]|uniref:nitrilase-related carbon-nitrogen hydrolase n=1 Tax=Nesterenkonia ebinurensis TaxID=2608252 RepID=UPI00123D3413|nr:nitrilase-related carbon-nitrogen hydrolase [Nesterenkonia ebinurensis]